LINDRSLSPLTFNITAVKLRAGSFQVVPTRPGILPFIKKE